MSALSLPIPGLPGPPPAPPSYYAPDFDVSIDGQPVPALMRASITGVRFEESLEGADRVEVTLANQGLRFLDHPLLALENRLELSLGYQPGAVATVFIGGISGFDPTFPSSGMPTVSVVAHNFMKRLQDGTKKRSFPWYLPDALIAAIVAAENLLLTVPDPAAFGLSALGLFNQRPRSQNKGRAGKSDYDFLREIAAEYGFDMWVDGNFMNFKFLIREQPPPQVELRWGESLLTTVATTPASAS